MKKLLFLSFRIPWPLNQGSNIRIYNEAKILSKKYDVDMFIVSEEKMTVEAREALSFCKVKHFKLNWWEKYRNSLKTLLFSDEPLQMNYFYSNEAKKWLYNKVLTEKDYDVIFCHHLRMFKYIHKFGVPVVFDIVDASAKMYKEGQKHIRGFWKFIYKEESKRMLDYEKRAVDIADLSLITSEVDKRYIGNDVFVMQNGIKEELFKMNNRDNRKYVAFLGKMTYKPNVDAVSWFVDEILPHVDCNYKFKVIGNPINFKLEKKYFNNNRIVFVHQDIYQHYKQAVVVVAPMRISGGIQNKILEAMALSKAIVTTPKCSEAIDERLPSTSDPEEFAKKINMLIKDEKTRAQFEKINREIAETNFRWDKIGQQLIDVMEEKLC